MTRIKTILWATDFSKDSRNCLPYIKLLSSSLQTRNVSLFVLPKFSDWVLETAFVTNDELLATVENARQQSTSKLQNITKKSGVSFECEVLEGTGSAEILDFAAENKVDMIFIGRRGNSEIEEMLIGSTTSRLIRNSSIPVCVVPKLPREPKIKKILCPIEMNDYSLLELEFAIFLAKQLGAELFVAHISELFNYKIPVLSRDKLLEKINEKIAQLATAHDYKIENFIFELGEPAKKILEIAKKNKMDLITMATHQRKGIEKIFLGSITEKVLMYSDIPVIVLPPATPKP
jgi:nucleotide-binding universal stress UspA family protein